MCPGQPVGQLTPPLQVNATRTKLADALFSQSNFFQKRCWHTLTPSFPLVTCVVEEEEEELHGKLEEDRFLFSLENDSATCDVLDLREVLSVFLKDG